MKLEALPGSHLTYCTNIHPGESLAEVKTILGKLVPDVKREAAFDGAFGVGLRLAGRAARELEAPAALDDLKALLGEHGLYVFTLNGFPYGAFHHTTVKQNVYLPDWFEDERVRYTSSLARTLAALLPAGVTGSISTVPGAFGPRATAPGASRALASNIVRVAAELVRLERETGRSVALALEPEPACFVETTAQALRFFEQDLFSPAAREQLVKLTGLAAGDAEDALRRHVGICLDACHASVEFERPLDSLRALRAAGIGVPKLQISAGLRLVNPGTETLEALRAFDDGVYLHQTVVRRGASSAGSPDGLSRYLDLPDALAEAKSSGADSEWRVHFHVPVFEPELGPFSSTQADLRELLQAAPELPAHLEVETYTFDVLPPAYRGASVSAAVARELAWTRRVLAERASGPGA